MKYVISYMSRSGHRLFVRWYKNGRQWVDRVHGETATQYTTREEAQRVGDGMKLDRMEVRTVR